MDAQELICRLNDEYLKETVNTQQIGISRFYLFSKRLCDITFSVIAIAALSIPMLCIGAAIKLSSKGPVIYKQERVGCSGRIFTIYKFRSMRTDAEESAPVWAKRDDDRATKIGKVLRKYHLDELPQLFNILKGEMSFVGPRPERDYFYREFEKDIPNFKDRLAVKPGLTGLAQINGGYDISPMEKFIIDKKYFSDLSVHNDIIIMLKTLNVVFRGIGAR